MGAILEYPLTTTSPTVVYNRTKHFELSQLFCIYGRMHCQWRLASRAGGEGGGYSVILLKINMVSLFSFLFFYFVICLHYIFCTCKLQL